MKEVKEYYRQRLPHIQPLGAAFFVTFRLIGSVPKVEFQKLKKSYADKFQKLNTIKEPKIRNQGIYQLRQDYFVAHEKLLESIKEGPHYLKKSEVANIIASEIHKFDKKLYQLICFTIMSNHVHLIIDTALNGEDKSDINTDLYKPLNVIMKRIKGSTAVKTNRILRRSGQFWDRESFDIYVRNEKMLTNVINYTINNPVKAGLVKEWTEWPYTYLAPSLSFK